MEVFTKKFKNVEDRILIDTTISFLKNKMKSNTLIDTGATISCISKDVVKTLKLQPIGVDRVSAPSGTAVLNKYLIDISFKKNMIFKNIFVLESEIGNQGIDLLVGMDILNKNDIMISNYDNHTQFSLRYPVNGNLEF